jgi:2-aminoadipate transaminase
MKNPALSRLSQRTQPPAISWLIQTALARPDLISLAAGFTDNRTLPVNCSRQLINSVLGSAKSGQPALQYGITAGEDNLRQLTARHLQTLDAASAATHDVKRTIITNGSQQLLYMTMEAICDPDDIVLVEDPTYFVFVSILQSRGIRARAIKLDRDGIDCAHLETVLKALEKSGELSRVKALYLITYFQNPTGVTTSLARKKQALALLKKFEKAAGHRLYLVEDAAYRELRFAGADVRSALTLPGAKERVIYTGTYSKPFAPGARLGFGILPEPLFITVNRIKGNHDFGTANLLQQLLARALTTGIYQRQLRLVQKNYRQKALAMKKAMKKHFPAGLEIWEPSGGLYFWVRLPPNLPAGTKSKLFRDALKQNVLYVPGQLCYAPDTARPIPTHELRLSFGSASLKNLQIGIARLGQVLKYHLT